jgi:hypothetical protein
MDKLARLRAAHPNINYTAFSWQLTQQKTLDIYYEYRLEKGERFLHQVSFAHLPDRTIDKLVTRDPDYLEALRAFAFQLGIVEMLSYWKIACCPTITISAHTLPDAALPFWQKLLLKGMSEYFYVNQINFTPANFVRWQTTTAQPKISNAWRQPYGRILVGFGGGKDSLVTARLLEKEHLPLAALIVEPASPAAAATAKNFDIPIHRVTRHLDPKLLALNQATDDNGQAQYFNGHVPFSASLAFIGNVCQLLYHCREFLVSNEQSANEATTTWLEQPINHQYSKSLEFEQDFQNYCREILSTKLHYRSYLRSYYELKIAQLFSQLATPEDIATFRSCNVGQKENVWCGKCAKCLFIFIILFPFLDTHLLTTKVFSHNLFEDESLLPLLDQLTGLTPSKPLECVGTVGEVQAAGYLAIAKYMLAGRVLPPLLSHLMSSVIKHGNDWDAKAAVFLSPVNTQ